MKTAKNPGQLVLMTILSIIFFSTLSMFLLTSCEESRSTDMDSKGHVRVGVTDAAVDAESITGVYLAVSEVHAKSETEILTIATFDPPQLINIMDYQNGQVYELGEGEAALGTYKELRLILDDESISSYITFDDDTQQTLDVPSGTSSGYKIAGDFVVSAANTTDLIVDIDLRKALTVTGQGDYKLRPTARLISENATGAINGQVHDADFEKLVVYAYIKGTYDASESDEPATGEARFENSINSATVAGDGSFVLAFLEEGDYDLIVSSYEEDETEDTYDFTSVIGSELLIDSSVVEEVSVEANAEVSLSIITNINL